MVKRVVTGYKGLFGTDYKIFDDNGNQVGEGQSRLFSARESRVEGDHLITEQENSLYLTRQSTRIRGSPKKREKNYISWGLDG